MGPSLSGEILASGNKKCRVFPRRLVPLRMSVWFILGDARVVLSCVKDPFVAVKQHGDNYEYHNIPHIPSDSTPRKQLSM